MMAVMDHEHWWVPLGNLQVCGIAGCSAHRATTAGAEEALADLGDAERLPPTRICDSCGATAGQCDASLADTEMRCCTDCTHDGALIGGRL